MPEKKNNHHFQDCEVGKWKNVYTSCSWCIDNLFDFAVQFSGRHGDQPVNRQIRSLPAHLGGGIAVMVERDEVNGLVECIDLKNEFGRIYVDIVIWDMLDHPAIGESDWIKQESSADA